MQPAVSHPRRSHGLLFAGWRSGLKEPWTMVCVGSPFRKAHRHNHPPTNAHKGGGTSPLALAPGFLVGFLFPLVMIVVLYASDYGAGSAKR